MPNNLETVITTLNTTNSCLYDTVLVLRLHKVTTLEAMGNMTVTPQHCFAAFSSSPVELVIEGEEVEMITVPAIRLLLAALQSVVRRGGSFRIQNPSEAMIKALQALGLEAFWLRHPFNQKKPL